LKEKAPVILWVTHVRNQFTYLKEVQSVQKVEKPTFESKKGHKTHESAKETSGGYRKTLPLHGQGLARF